MATNEPENPGEYSIAAVSKLTGVSCHALRVWERRYGFPVPHRSASLHRRYTREQVRQLRQVAEKLRRGQSIADVMVEIREGGLDAGEEPISGLAPDLSGGPIELVDRLVRGDLEGGEACYSRLASQLDPESLISGVIVPSMIDTGERWFRRECEIYQEHCATSFLRRKLQAMIENAKGKNDQPKRTILIGTVQGDRHSGGLLILNLLLERRGWSVVNLGVDLPVREYQKAAEAWRPDAVGLSFVLSRNINKRFRELAQIKGIPLFVGGRSILNYQGLARRHGLIPLSGAIGPALAELGAAYEAWARNRLSSQN